MFVILPRSSLHDNSTANILRLIHPPCLPSHGIAAAFSDGKDKEKSHYSHIYFTFNLLLNMK